MLINSKLSFHIFFSLILIAVLGVMSSAYADSLTFDQDYLLFDHGVRANFTGSPVISLVTVQSDVELKNFELKRPQVYNLDDFTTPIAYFPFDYDTLDKSGNGNNGTPTGPITYDPGVYVNGATFTASDSTFATLANESNFDFDKTEEFSVSFFMKNSLSGTPGVFVSKGNIGAANQAWAVWQWAGNNKVYFSLYDNGAGYSVNSGTTFNDGNWHSVIATYDGTGNRNGMKLYVDGVLKNTGTSATITGDILNNNPVKIGATAANGKKLTGSIDDLRIYNFTLTKQGESKTYYTDFLKFITSNTPLPNNPDQIAIPSSNNVITVTSNGIEQTFQVIDENVELSPDYNVGKYKIGRAEACSSYGGDSDEDGICNDWETDSQTPLRINFSGETEVYTLDCDPLANYDPESADYDPLGINVCPNPNKADIYLEIDWMKGHKPNHEALVKLVNSFQSSTYQPEVGEKGVNLHIQLSDNDLPHDPEIKSPGWKFNPGTDQLKLIWFGTGGEREIENPSPPSNFWNNITRAEKSQVFHYVIFGHTRTGSVDASGYSELYGNDIFMTLGNWDYSVGSEDHQAGTLMHELGHNLGLHHGGADSINCKPNYLSVMSYTRQFSDLLDNRPLDYSRVKMDSLSEPSDVIGSYSPEPPQQTVYGDFNGSPLFVWTNATNPEIEGDFNKIPTAGCSSSSSSETYDSYEDWNTIVFIDRTHSSWLDGVPLDGDTRPGEVDAPDEPDDELCVPVQSRSANAPTNPRDRQCVVEDISLDNIRKIQGQILADVEQNIGQNMDRDCMAEVQRLLAEIRQDIGMNNLVDALSKIKELQDYIQINSCFSDNPDKKDEVISALQNLLNSVSRAVPEFETIAITILSISIVSVIVLTKKTKLNIKTQF